MSPATSNFGNKAAPAPARTASRTINSEDKRSTGSGLSKISAPALEAIRHSVPAIAGCDAVISSLGTPMNPFREVTTLSKATHALVGVMAAQNIHRLVCITGMGAGDSHGHGRLFYDRLLLTLMLRKVYEDKDRQEDAIRASILDWTIVRPTVLNDKPARGRIRALTDLSDINGGTIARPGVADFVVPQIEANRWLRKAPLITW